MKIRCRLTRHVWRVETTWDTMHYHFVQRICKRCELRKVDREKHTPENA